MINNEKFSLHKFTKTSTKKAPNYLHSANNLELNYEPLALLGADIFILFSYQQYPALLDAKLGSQ